MYKQNYIDIPIYYTRLKVIICDDSRELASKDNIRISDNVICIGQVLNTECYYENGYSEIILILNPNHDFEKVDIGVISHECMHATTEILYNRGIDLKVNDGSNETYAYLVGYLVKAVSNLYLSEGFKL